MKTYKQFITEAWNRRPQRASKRNKAKKATPEQSEKKAYVVVGTPATGKSSMVKQMKSKNPNVDQQELDISRKKLGKHPAHFSNQLMQHHQDEIKKSAEKGKTIVVSNTSIPKTHRTAALDNLTKLGYDAKAVLAPGSRKAALRRNKKRTGTEPGSSRVPNFVMNAMGRQMKGVNTNPRGGGALSRRDLRAARKEYKKLHKEYRFTKPAMKRSGAIR